MLEKGSLLHKLYENVFPAGKNLKIADLRIGLGYVGVKLSHGGIGLAAVLGGERTKGCMVLSQAGRFAGAPASVLLRYLQSADNVIERALGLACANALVNPPMKNCDNREATTHLQFKENDRVVMVGLFSPLVEKIRSSGVDLAVIEKDPQRGEILSSKAKRYALRHCEIAIITATTLLNDTFEETINMLGAPRSVMLLGPSTPLVPEIFQGTPVTHLGGIAVSDAQKVLQVISEGGGTPALRPYLCFVNIPLR